MNELAQISQEVVVPSVQMVTLNYIISQRISVLIGGNGSNNLSSRQIIISHKDLLKIKDILFFLQKDGFDVGNIENIFDQKIISFSFILNKFVDLLNICISKICENPNYYKLAKIILTNYVDSFSINYLCNLQGLVYFNKIYLKQNLSTIKYKEYIEKINYLDNIISQNLNERFPKKELVKL